MLVSQPRSLRHALGRPGPPFWITFLMKNVIYFGVVFCMPFWIALLSIFSDFGIVFDSLLGKCLICF